VDNKLRRLLLAQLAEQTLKEGDSLVLPEALRIQRLPADQFKKFRETLGGLTVENEQQVRTKLQDIGVIPGAGIITTQEQED
jgi:hypothetical protein